MDLVSLQRAQKVLNACGFVHQDRGGTFVPLEKWFLLPMQLQAFQTLVFTKEITTETVFGLRAFSCDQGLSSITGVRLQIQLPNGRYLFGGNGIDVGQFAYVGSYRFPLDEDCDCDPGSKVSVTLSDANTAGLASPLAVNLVLHGPEKFYLKGPAFGQQGKLASLVPRYWGIQNENIIAPSYRAGALPAVPDGVSDKNFTYSSPVVSLPVAGPVTNSMKIPIDKGIDFKCSRILCVLTPDTAVTAGTVLMRLRTGDGYALNDDYLDVPRLIAGAEFPVDWLIKQADSVVVDMALVDAAGTGNMNVQVHLEGAKRRSV